jgi:hypothetical protein
LKLKLDYKLVNSTSPRAWHLLVQAKHVKVSLFVHPLVPRGRVQEEGDVELLQLLLRRDGHEAGGNL